MGKVCIICVFKKEYRSFQTATYVKSAEKKALLYYKEKEILSQALLKS